MKLIAILLLLSINCPSQPVNTIDCNTVFICLDTSSYNALFENTYIKDTLFYCREESTKTTDDAYTGKYAQGQSATLEFFKPVDFNSFGNHIGECGIEFKTRVLGALDLVEDKANSLKIKIDTSTSIYDDSGKQFTWYKTVKITDAPETFEFNILEYQKSFLESLGFDSSEISEPMMYASFIKKVSQGRKFKRQFSEIKSVTIEGNAEVLKGIKSLSRLIGLKENGDKFYNSDFCIYFKSNNAINKMKVDQIKISLLTEQKKHLIDITKNISVLVNHKNAILSFK